MNSSTIEIPARPAFNPRWLFHHPRFFRSNDAAKCLSFYQYSSNEVLAMLRCCLNNGVADAAVPGFYGCLEMNPGADPVRFLQYAESSLREKGCSRLSLTLFPEQYDPVSWPRQREAIQAAGYRLEGSIVHRMILVTEEENEPLASSDWRSSANTINEFRVTQEPLDQYRKIAQLIQRTDNLQDSNGHEEITEKSSELFPDKTFLFAVRDGAKFCGQAVLLEVGPGVMYLLHLSQPEEYDGRRPVLALMQFLYEWAELRGVRYIDLGQITLGLEEHIGMVQGTAERWVGQWS